MKYQPLFIYDGIKVTERERDVWRLLAMSENVKAIASSLGISQKTVEYHRSRVAKKLGMKDLASFTRKAIRSRLIKL